MSAHAPLAYDIVGQRVMAGQRTVARVTCARCGAEACRTMTGTHNPELVVKDFRRKGWEVEMNNRARVVCPACIAKRKEDRKMKQSVADHEIACMRAVLDTVEAAYKASK